MMNKVSSWGESMYGGYYAQVWVNDKYIGFHADTLKELRRQLAEVGITTLKRDLRWDN